jgi:5-oxopent-3-ene-1,2,5-tricarboxylate decarboxylase/2-hydroxyhepta-2,4-diene-1,7-dioate isomerase
MNFTPTGTVYGTLLNFRSEVQALAPKMHDAPYKAPPKAPILYVKPANTWSADNDPIPVPAHVPEVEIGATLAMVMKSPAEIAGYVLMNDLSVPHTSFFRPPVKFKCLDGFLGIGSELARVDPASLQLQVRINGRLEQTVQFDALVREPQQLLAQVSEFMTLRDGDMLMIGCGWPRPRAVVGDRIELSAPGLRMLTNTLVAQAG